MQEFWVTCACPEKQSCPGIFHCIEYTLYIQEFWATCVCPEKQSCPEIFRCMEYTFYIHNFWAACPCPEKQSFPDIFHCIEQVPFIIQKFWITCACLEKQRVPWNFSLFGIYFLHSGVVGQFACACPEKQRVPWYFHCIEHAFFIIQHILATSASPENRVDQKCFALWNILFTFRIFEQLAFALKNRGCPEFTILNVFFLLFRIFEQLALALKIFCCIEYIFYYSGVLNNLRLPWKQSCPGIFHCIEYTFYIQNFWVTCPCPEKQRVPWIHFIECIFFIIQDFWATCACPEKQSCPGIFHCAEIYFIIQDFWGNCGCPENRVCPEIFQARGATAPPPRTPMAVSYKDFHIRKFPVERWKLLQPELIHCVRLFVCIAINAAPYDLFFSFNRKLPNGLLLPSWLTQLGPSLLQSFMCSGSDDDLFLDVHSTETKPQIFSRSTF